ncbi:thioredoxin domain-containing protein 11 [Musca vetustissima]|uniref:thioredoxin domain-containing protein 11 n=1 Tax=Musca vetustissima TaxID=27455 RepID=UPI002AB7CD97|nr:thioredoxin domain-containing protein 11 [Musca vetustissima]
MSRLMSVFIILLIIANATITNGNLYTVAKCPGLDVARIRQHTQQNEISLIFYYTRWSGDSLLALKEYNDVAVYYGDKIFFSSVDCWHLACNCSRVLGPGVGSGPNKWPTLMAYYGRRGQLQIQYHGLWSFRGMQNFIDNLLQPLKRFPTNESLQQAHLKSDALIMGVFESPNCMEYKQYLMASVKWLESDPLRTYVFGVDFVENVSKAKGLLAYERIPDIVYMGSSDTKKFREIGDYSWNASHILQWLHKELKLDLINLHGYSTPIAIAQKLQENSVLAIFVNDAFNFYGYMEQYVQPISRSNCNVSRSKCLRVTKLKEAKENNIQQIYEKMLDISMDDKNCYCNIKEVLTENLANYYDINMYLTNLISHLAYPNKQIVNSDIHELLEFHHTTKCLNSDPRTSNELQIITAKYLQSIVDTDKNFYNSNRTLSVVLLDTDKYRDYLENLDIERNKYSMATAFIVDVRQEGIFPLTHDFDMDNLKEYIQQFYQYNLLPRYKSENINFLISRLKTQTMNEEKDSNIFEVLSLNRLMLLNNLQYVHNQTLVLLIHTPECALCGSLQHTFIQIAGALRYSCPELQFARINAHLNDLPWQFNMASLPALLVFPKNRYGDSRLFPSHLKPDFRNVFGFILKQLPAEDQIKATVTLCQSPVLNTLNTQSCWRFAKNLLTQHIGQYLHYWELFENERKVIFEHLRAFKDTSLDVQRNLKL